MFSCCPEPRTKRVGVQFMRLGLLLTALLGVSLLLAAKPFSLPRPAEARTYPAHDEHAADHVTVAIDPYDTSERAAIFKVKWQENGYLPVYLVISNGGDQPIALIGMQVEWTTVNGSKLRAATDDDLERRLSHIKRRGDEPPMIQLPVPTTRKPKVGVSKDAREEIDTAQFRAVAVEPHTTRAGFVFFDIGGLADPLAGAVVYVSGITDANGRPLMFFEIPVDKYLSAGGRPPASR
jgi:hypothetical protein